MMYYICMLCTHALRPRPRAPLTLHLLLNTLLSFVYNLSICEYIYVFYIYIYVFVRYVVIYDDLLRKHLLSREQNAMCQKKK